MIVISYRLVTYGFVMGQRLHRPLLSCMGIIKNGGEI